MSHPTDPSLPGFDARRFKAFCHFDAFFQVVSDAGLSDIGIALVHGEPDKNGITRATLLDTLHDIQQKAHAVFKASAVFVGATVGVRA